MNKVAERKRQRREYLKVRMIAALSVGVSILLAIGALYLIYSIVPQANGDIIQWCGLLILLSAPIAGGIVLWREAQQAHKEARRIYVPPVTPDTLPAEEILVRAADEPPVAQSEVLLRAAQAGQETPKEELLRVSQGE